jgi:hypothetical protein
VLTGPGHIGRQNGHLVEVGYVGAHKIMDHLKASYASYAENLSQYNVVSENGQWTRAGAWVELALLDT